VGSRFGLHPQSFYYTPKLKILEKSLSIDEKNILLPVEDLVFTGNKKNNLRCNCSDWKLFAHSNILNRVKICCSVRKLWPEVSGGYFYHLGHARVSKNLEVVRLSYEICGSEYYLIAFTILLFLYRLYRR
jgi:hypothetical protein